MTRIRVSLSTFSQRFDFGVSGQRVSWSVTRSLLPVKDGGMSTGRIQLTEERVKDFASLKEMSG